MSLQDRLQAARSARRIDAGLPPEDPSDPADDIAPVIDLRDAAITRRLEHAPSFTTAVAVAETGDHCPACGGPTRLDLVDIVGGVDHFTCLDCKLLFQAAHVVPLDLADSASTD